MAPVTPPPTPQEGGSSDPIQNQPDANSIRESLTGDASVQERLREVTSFVVNQKVELAEIAVGWESENSYTVKDQNGNKVFYVCEKSSWFARQCWGPSRRFKLHVRDLTGQHVLTFERPNFGVGQILITSSAGKSLGSVEVTRCSFFKPSWIIKDAAGKSVLKAKAPVNRCCGQVVFRLLTLEGAQVGTISKDCKPGLEDRVRGWFSDADFFSVSFETEFDLATKAACLGLLFLIDFQFFEGDGKCLVCQACDCLC